MCHGGTDFGRIASSPYITTSCDYDATLDEFDNLNQPKRGHWKDFQTILKWMRRNHASLKRKKNFNTSRGETSGIRGEDFFGFFLAVEAIRGEGYRDEKKIAVEKPIIEDLQSISVCGHVFHEFCLQQWVEYCACKKKNNCPVLITTQKVLFCAINSLCFKHFCVVVLHFYSNWYVKDLVMTSNHICG